MRVMVRWKDDRCCLLNSLHGSDEIHVPWFHRMSGSPESCFRSVRVSTSRMREPLWQNFAVQQSPSIPRKLCHASVGIDYGDKSLTYILLNPFDNELAFERQGTAARMGGSSYIQNNYPEMRHGMMVVPGPLHPSSPRGIFRKGRRDWALCHVFEKVKGLPEWRNCSVLLTSTFGLAGFWMSTTSAMAFACRGRSNSPGTIEHAGSFLCCQPSARAALRKEKVGSLFRVLKRRSSPD